MPAPEVLLPSVVELVDRAGALIMEFYAAGAEGRAKSDGSPVTAADEAAEGLILEGLRALTPEVPVVAEESVSKGEVPDVAGRRFWLVDPLDGTKEFLSRNGEFTVNVALIEAGAPVLGVVGAPAIDEAWWGVAGFGAVHRAGGVERAIKARAWPEGGAVAMVSRSHLDPKDAALLEREGVASHEPAGSSLKLGRIAEGRADVYPRHGRTMEWDTAAGHAVLLAAGGRVLALDGAPLAYGKKDFANDGGFVARGEG